MEQEQGKSRVLRLIGDVDGETIDRLLRDVGDLMDENRKEEVTLYLASGGGSVPAGLAFYEFIRMNDVPLTVIGVGEIASIAVIIWLAGKKRKVSKRSFFLIHQVGSDFERVSFKTKSIRDESERMQFLEKIIYNIIAEAAGRSVDEVEKIAQERYISLCDAIKFGLLKKQDVISY